MKRRVCAVVEATRFVGVQLRYAFKVCSLRIRVASIPFDHLTISTLDASFRDELMAKICKDCWVVSVCKEAVR